MVLTQDNIWLQLWGDTRQGDWWLPAVCICGIWGPQGMWRCILQDGQCANWWPAHTRWLQPECGTHSVERQRCALVQLIVDILWAANLICVREGSCLYVCVCLCVSRVLLVIFQSSACDLILKYRHEVYQSMWEAAGATFPCCVFSFAVCTYLSFSCSQYFSDCFSLQLCDLLEVAICMFLRLYVCVCVVLAVQICLKSLRPYLCVTFVRGSNLPVVS